MSRSWDLRGHSSGSRADPARLPIPTPAASRRQTDPFPTAARLTAAATGAADRRHTRRSEAERTAAAAPTRRAGPGDPGADPPARPARGRSRSPPPPRWHWRPRSPPGRCWPPTAEARGTARYRPALPPGAAPRLATPRPSAYPVLGLEVPHAMRTQRPSAPVHQHPARRRHAHRLPHSGSSAVCLRRPACACGLPAGRGGRGAGAPGRRGWGAGERQVLPLPTREEESRCPCPAPAWPRGLRWCRRETFTSGNPPPAAPPGPQRLRWLGAKAGGDVPVLGGRAPTVPAAGKSGCTAPCHPGTLPGLIN